MDCLACRLTQGKDPLPGGRVFATDHWVVEHCIGPLGVGTLIAKPMRHCQHLWDMTEQESRELGPLITRVTDVIKRLTDVDQVYACLWSHAGWKPGHIHFVLQPSWNGLRDRFPGPGPALQQAMFAAAEPLDPAAVEEFCDKARFSLMGER